MLQFCEQARFLYHAGFHQTHTHYTSMSLTTTGKSVWRRMSGLLLALAYIIVVVAWGFPLQVLRILADRADAAVRKADAMHPRVKLPFMRARDDVEAGLHQRALRQRFDELSARVDGAVFLNFRLISTICRVCIGAGPPHTRHTSCSLWYCVLALAT